MIENLQFIHQKWLWPMLLGGAVLWLLFLWKEYPKKHNSLFYINSLVSLIALTALVLIALKPVTLKMVETGAGAILTNGYSQERLDSLRSTDSNMKVVPYQMNKSIGGVLDSMAPLFILGDGVRPFDLWQFDSIPAIYLGSETPKGIIALNYGREIPVGETLRVRGRLNSPENGNRLVLAAPGGTELDSVILDSPILDSSEQADFVLSTEMEVEGSYIYSLIEKDSTGKTMLTEPLPVTVVPKKPLKMLLVNSFPTFESKYLKNYLAEMGHGLIVRSQLTRGKYKFEYFNTDRNPIYGFSRQGLEGIDILIIDVDSYLNLSQTSGNALKEAVEKDGLGIFIQPDNRLFSTLKSKFDFDWVEDGNTETGLEGWPKLKVDTYPFRFESGIGLEKIHGGGKEIRTAYRRVREGRIGTTTIQDTYQWILEGHSRAYREFWSDVIGTLSKREGVATILTGRDDFAFRNMPYTFEVRTTYALPEILGNQAEEIPVKQHPDIPELWSGTVYPRKTGWNQLQLRNDSASTHRFYVMDSSNFQALTRHRIQQANSRFFNGASPIAQKRMLPKQISRIWFYIVFLAAMGWLWLGPKILGGS